MGSLVSYELADSIATITMDDGKVNALSLAMLGEVRAAFDRAEADGAVVVLTGREGMFSAGFDLRVIAAGTVETVDLLQAGFGLAERILSHPHPVVIAVPGHAIAMGLFLVLSGDYRLGAAGRFKLTANEVAIGMTLPETAIEILRQRLAPAHLQRAALLSEVYDPDAAVAAGMLDRVVPAPELADAARAVAAGFTQLDMAAHASTKRRLRDASLRTLRAAIDRDDAALRARL
jgi:enoyl-CoA hydratase